MIRVTFTERVHQPDGWQYNKISITSHDATGAVLVLVAPSVGDLIYTNLSAYRVIGRAWSWPEYGSRLWPTNTDAPKHQELDVIVERAFGLFIHESVQSTD